MVTFTTAQTQEELEEILALQAINLSTSVSRREAQEQGFVTVHHDYPTLAAMNEPYAHIIAKAEDKVVGYALVMLPAFGDQIEVLTPMFQKINQLSFKGQSLQKMSYFVMGQVCIAKAYRGLGIFKGLYNTMRTKMSPHFDCIITEVATRNTRSARAHEKVGFETIHTFEDATDEWAVIAWDWT